MKPEVRFAIEMYFEENIAIVCVRVCVGGMYIS